MPSVKVSFHAHMQEFGDSGRLVHSGMLASAEWLSERLSCIALVSLAFCAVPARNIATMAFILIKAIRRRSIMVNIV
jgi:hypothetical protein